MKQRKDPHPLSLKTAEWISSILILLVLAGPGVWLIVMSAHNAWNGYQLGGGILLIGTAFALIGLLLRQK